MSRNPFEQPDDETNREEDLDFGEDGDEPDWMDSQNPVVRALAKAVAGGDEDVGPCTRKGCRGCDKLLPIADPGSEPPF